VVAATSAFASASASTFASIVNERHLVEFASTTLTSSTIDDKINGNDTIATDSQTTANTDKIDDQPINAGPTRTGGGSGANNLIHIFLLSLVVCLACLTLGDGMYRCVLWWYAPTPEPEEKFTPEQQKEQWIHFFKLHRVQLVRSFYIYIYLFIL
jgi:hypothetical protein